MPNNGGNPTPCPSPVHQERGSDQAPFTSTLLYERQHPPDGG
jgi:hypothetical protein